MKTAIKNFLSTKKVFFTVILGFFLVVFSIAGFYCHYADCYSSCVVSSVSTEKSSTASEGGKCRQCGRQLRHKGYFCSENCRERYANEYHNERYGKAICRNCGKEFIKATAYSYFCSPQCQYDYYEDLKLVGEAEEYRKTKQNNEAK